MTEYADLELCKELYELSGWDRDEDRHPVEKVWMRSYHTSEMGPAHDDYDTTPEEQRREVVVGEWRVTDNPRGRMTTGEEVFKWWYSKVRELELEAIPAYTCGYLLRKLLPMTLVKSASGNYEARWISEGEVKLRGQSESSPENAVCRLAIKLFKQEILTRGDEL